MRGNLLLLSLFQSDTCIHDIHIIIRFVCFWMSLYFTDELTDIHAFNNMTKHCVLVIKPRLERGGGGGGGGGGEESGRGIEREETKRAVEKERERELESLIREHSRAVPLNFRHADS
jgi:hypothetical protein